MYGEELARMTWLLTLLLLLTPAAESTSAQLAANEGANTSFPFLWLVPEGFRAETIPFPLDFAPELAYKGVEEIRFAPGFRDPLAPDYFTYSFIWYVEDTATITPSVLERDLKNYFTGLMEAVQKPGQTNCPTSVEVKPGTSTDSATDFPAKPSLAGTIKTWDAFFTGKPITLEFEVFEPPSQRAAEKHYKLYYFEVSPQLDSPAVRALLSPLRQSLVRD